MKVLLKIATAAISISLSYSTALSQTAQIEPFVLNIMNGPTTASVFDSTEHPSGVFVMEVFQSTCGPCISNAPKVDALSDAYADGGRVQVLDVGLSNQTPRDYARWIAGQHPNHPVTNGNADIFNAIGIVGTPTTAIFDCNLNLVHKHVGSWDTAAESGIYAAINDSLENTECLAE